MGRIRRSVLVSSSLTGSGHRRRRQRVLMLCRTRGWPRTAPQKRRPIRIWMLSAPFDERNEAPETSPFSSEWLERFLGTLKRRRPGAKLILQLPRNKAARKIPYSAWIDMLDDLRLWVPALTLPILTSSDLALFPLVVKHTDVIKLRPDHSEIDLVSLMWQLRKFPTTAGFKCSIVFR